jgi:serine O-acetyltransferase
MRLLKSIWEDAKTALERDPAARGMAEVLLCYPGVRALAWHRVAHALWARGFKLAARMMADGARTRTGIEIHPAARMGRRVFIDHGMGVVIGETAEVGDGCTLFHGVTLGGLSGSVGKRHPSVGRHVLIGAGATILGPISIGDGAKVGAGAVVLNDIPAGAVAVGMPAKYKMSP